MKKVKFDYFGEIDFTVYNKQKVTDYLPKWKLFIARLFSIPIEPKYNYVIIGTHDNHIPLNTVVRIVVNNFHYVYFIKTAKNMFSTVEPVSIAEIQPNKEAPIQIIGSTINYKLSNERTR